MPRSRSRSPEGRRRDSARGQERERERRADYGDDARRREDDQRSHDRPGRSASHDRYRRSSYREGDVERERGRDRSTRHRSYSPERKKRRSRSVSASSSSASSSDSESEDDRERRRRKERKSRRSRSRSRSRSRDRDRERDRSRERRKEKERKRRKEEQRERRKRREEKRAKKAAKKARKEGGSVKTFGYYGILSEADINTKDSEFRAWLIEERKMNPETVPNSKMKDLFKSFAEDWNTVTLPDKYYNLEAHERMMRSIANGDTLPGDEIYDFRRDEADINKRARASAPVTKTEDHLTYEALEELRRIQRERVEGTQLKRLGLQGKQSLGVRYE